MKRPSIYQTKITTDGDLMETISHGTKDYPFRFYDEHMAQFDFSCISWHWHTELEFVYVATESIWVDIGSERLLLEEGQGIFINTKILHRFTSTADAGIPNFLFHPTFIAPIDSYLYQYFVLPLLNADLPYQIFLPHIPWQKNILTLMQELIVLQNEEASELRTASIVSHIWHILFSESHFSAIPPKASSLASNEAKLQILMGYMHTNYAKEITLDTLVEQIHLSKSTITALFQSYLHTSPIQYLILYRLEVAAKLLIHSEKKLSSIALETGFHSIDYFCKVFKNHYKLTPTAYRQKHQYYFATNK